MTSTERREAAPDPAKMSGSGPVFFLVQEQAKSIVAIQELQTRMTVLEGLQERLMQAIKDVQLHLESGERTKPSARATAQSFHAKALPRRFSSVRSGGGSASTSTAKVADSSGPVKGFVGKQHSYSERIVQSNRTEEEVSAGTSKTRSHSSSEDETLGCSAKDYASGNKPKSDSYNKDSGIGASDSSLAHSELNNNGEEPDELLQLLELIDQKSLVLLQQVEQTMEQQNSGIPISEMGDPSRVDDLLFEKVDTERQLCEVKAERDELRRKLAKLELATEAVTKEKRKVQEKLDATLSHNYSLQERMQRNAPEVENEKLGYLADIEKANVKRKYMQYSEKSRRRVSTVLKETSVLELQKQLLTYIMENDVLRAKLQQDKPTTLSSWLKIEARLKEDLKEAKADKRSLLQVIETKDREIASLKERVSFLEDAMENDKCVKNFGLGSADDWREPGAVHANPYNKQSNLNANTNYSPLAYGDFSKTQSLPAMLFLDSKLRKKDKQEVDHQRHYGPVFDTGSFTDVPLDRSYDSCAPVSHQEEESNDLVDLTPQSDPAPNYSSASHARVQPHYLVKPVSSTPDLTGQQNWELRHRLDMLGGAKLVNGHLCWKGTEKDISSICTEFDPLSETPSCENFVDSLNLSIPLKPTQVPMSQLSSIGDSLHSASLDLGCASSALYQDSRSNIQNARSVDGIRELLLDNVYYKTRPQYKQPNGANVISARNGAHVLAVKGGRRLPVNLTNCSHDSSDYSLL